MQRINFEDEKRPERVHDSRRHCLLPCKEASVNYEVLGHVNGERVDVRKVIRFVSARVSTT